MKKILGVLAVILIVVLVFKYSSKSEDQSTASTDIVQPVAQKTGFVVEKEEPIEDEKESTIQKDPVPKEKEVEKKAFEKKDFRTLSDEEIDRLEDYFEQVEGEWGRKIESLLGVELGLGEEVVAKYKKMREGFEQDKMEAYEDFHEEMTEKYGEDYIYNPSEAEVDFAEEVRKRYESELIQIIGDESFTRYLEMRDEFNTELKKREDPSLGYIVIDF